MAFSDSLDRETTTIALCWRIARSDGVVLGFTSHDAAIDVGGLRYEASPGMTPSAIASGLGLEVATMEFAGALSAGAMTDADLAAGRFDGARLDVFMVDWCDPAAGTLPIARGTLGAVERTTSHGRGGFTATVRGPTAAFDRIAVETCSPMCRAELGDARCRVDLAPLTAIVVAAGGTATDVSVADDPLEGLIDGRLRCLDGPNAGIDARIADATGRSLTLLEPLPTAVSRGTRIELREGCDKRIATCAGRFANAVNFQGEPHVPGSDVLTRFPGV